MATIIGGIAASHTPTIGFAFDRDKRDDPMWAPIFTAFDPVRQWLAQNQPDVLLFIYNDHVTSFFFDHYSAFALGDALCTSAVRSAELDLPTQLRRFAPTSFGPTSQPYAEEDWLAQLPQANPCASASNTTRIRCEVRSSR
jgi:Catalytic LigB subunit of aromatic ring-opening dioxygenase